MTDNTSVPDTQTQIDIAGIKKDITYLVKGFDLISGKIDGFPNSFTPTKDFVELKTTYEANHKVLEDKVSSLQKYLYLGLGGLSVITFGIKLFWK